MKSTTKPASTEQERREPQFDADSTPCGSLDLACLQGSPQVGLDDLISEIMADAVQNPADYVLRSNTGVDGE